MTLELSASPESIIESVKVISEPRECSCQHSECRLFEIRWTEPDGRVEQCFRPHCPHPLCEPERRRLRLRDSPPDILIEAWVPKLTRIRASVATVYLLIVEDPEGRTLPKIEARIGICSQWRDRQAGNVDPDGEWIPLDQRYWAESGPGIYEIPIEERNPPKSFGDPTRQPGSLH